MNIDVIKQDDETLLQAIQNFVKPSLKGIKKGSRRSSKQKNNQYKTYKNTQFIKFAFIFIIILLVVILITIVNGQMQKLSPQEVDTESWTDFKNILIVILVVCVIMIILSYFETFRPWLDVSIKTLATVSLFYVATSFFELNYKANIGPFNKTINFLTGVVLVLFSILNMQLIFTYNSSEIYNTIAGAFNYY
jgi:hypothetical protein